jgi:hypothetical protein
MPKYEGPAQQKESAMGHYIPKLNHWEEDIVVFVAQWVRLGDITIGRVIRQDFQRTWSEDDQ